MFLKRLEIVGFKSFAERTTIDFVPGVTAVVGPNGSGKSNISDGIRWVLGEQSAKSLRGAKMEDIIFAGSDSRKPLNFAELTLTLNNEDQHIAIDYNEVSVTRRVYRSGESEFYINKQSCRLKDIHELFMDSGLGREAYSIIGQGKIEEILSNKSEERRVIFEEAAGVLKYKTRKQKAEHKLAETEENLFRIEDILYELENQIEPLKIQASIAKDFLEKKQELEHVEVALLVHEIEQLHENWQEQIKKVEGLSDQQIQITAQIKVLESKIEQHRSNMHELDHSIQILQDTLLATSEDLEKSEGQKQVLQERKKNYDQAKEALLKNMNGLKEKKRNIEEILLDENQKLANIMAELSKTTTQLEEEEQRLQSLEVDVEEELERSKSDYIEVLNEQATLRNEIRYLEEQMRLRNQKIEQLDRSNKSLLTEREQLLEKEGIISDEFKDKQGILKNQIRRYHSKKQELEKMSEEYQKKETQLYQAISYLQQIKSRKDVLVEMQTDFSGFFQGVKEILKARDGELKGIEGAVAELISVPKNFEQALEITLGSAAQHIVVRSETDARKAIDFLKLRRLGRATFLPLTVIKAREIPQFDVQKLRSHPSFIGIAAQLIQFEEKYRTVISNLLGQVVIAKDLQGANEIARLIQHKYRIVTLAGDVVNPGGSMTGGSVKQKGNPLLGRQREIEELTVKHDTMEQQIKEMEAIVKSLKKRIRETKLEVEELQSAGEKLRSEEQQCKSMLRELEIELRNYHQRLAFYDQDKHSIQTEILEMETLMELAKEKLVQIGEQKERLDEKINDLTNRKNNQQSTKASMGDKITALKIKRAKEEEQYRSINDQVIRLANEKEEIEKEWKSSEEEYLLLEKEMNSNSSGKETIEEMIEAKRLEKERTLQMISDQRQQRLKLQQLHDDFEREGKELKRQQKQLLEYLHTEEVKANRLDVDLENRLDKLSSEYEISFEAAKAAYELTIDPKVAKSKVKLIKLAIEELGTVNLGAIEEFERVSERFSFLLEQKEDLQTAKKTLYQVITEMDEEMTLRFEAMFTQIREQFQIVFKQMFGGGSADLQLTDPEHKLTTGVDIVAQPPGKKLQNLALLSGGERALTAITLLFAILKVRPVPFCVLDEVEAALDEANVSRFAKYLKEFSKETQFIVVTHRKGTMEEADVLYGVTMQESGVSKLVSVRLEETNELIPN